METNLEDYPVATVYHIEGVVKSYRDGGRTTLANKGITLTIEQGEIFGLLGPNGAGKSTLVRQMVGLLTPDQGRILFFSQDLRQHSTLVKRSVGYLSQEPFALQDLTVEQAIYFTGCLRRMSPREARQMTDELIVTWQLEPIRHTIIRYLSSGQRRLVGLAAALIGRSPVLLLDEPTNDLDPSQRQRVWNYLRQLKAEEGTTVILVTHSVLEAERVLERVAIIADGQVVSVGGVGEIKAQVDNRIHLDLTFKPESMAAHVYDSLAQFNRLQWVGKNRAIVLVERTQASVTIESLLNKVSIDQLEDFRIQSASLEDVYIRLISDLNVNGKE